MHMTTVPTFSDEVLAMGLDAYERKATYAGPRFYSLTGRINATVQFLNNPWDSPTDWVNYREIRAYNGLRSGDRLPGGLAAFPAVDRREQVSPQTGKPVMVTVVDPLLDLIEPGQYDKDGKVKPATVLAINAVFLSGRMGEKDSNYEPQPGQHIVLKMSRRMGEQLINKFRERLDENPEFDATLFAWKLSVQGEGVNSTIVVAKDTSGAVPSEGIEPYNIPEILNDVRQRVEAAVADIANNTPRFGAVRVSDIPDVEDPFTSDDTSVDQFEKEIAALTAADMLAPEPVVANDPFDGVSDARLKKAIASAGAVVPRGASRDILINIAGSVGITSASDLS